MYLSVLEAKIHSPSCKYAWHRSWFDARFPFVHSWFVVDQYSQWQFQPFEWFPIVSGFVACPPMFQLFGIISFVWMNRCKSGKGSGFAKSTRCSVAKVHEENPQLNELFWYPLWLDSNLELWNGSFGNPGSGNHPTCLTASVNSCAESDLTEHNALPRPFVPPNFLINWHCFQCS